MIEFPAHKPETPSACRDFFPSGVPPGDLFLFGSRLCAPDPGPASHGQTPVRSYEIRFADDDLWGALQGLTVNWPLNLETFSPPDFTVSGGWKSLLTVNGTPWFLVRKSPHGTVFLWISPELPDIKRPLSPNDLIHKERIISCKLAMLPFFVFFRHSFGSKIWHAPVPYANLIIDDPPVSERYGFFSPARHLAALHLLKHQI